MTSEEAVAYDEACRRISELENKLHKPETEDFFEGIRLEAAYQREVHPEDVDKTPAEWFWTIGFLLGKALHFPEKRKHHLISSAALLANWHYYATLKEKS